MASSIRSFYQVCCRSYYLRVSTFFPGLRFCLRVPRAPISLLSFSPFTFSFVRLPFSRGIVLSYTLKNRTHFSSTLIEFPPPRPKLLSSPSQFLCIQLIFSPDLLRRVSRFLPTKNKQPSSLLTKRHESCRGENGKWKKNNETAQVSLLLLDFFRSNVDRFSPRDEHNPRENRNHRWRSSIALTRGKVLYNL